MIKGKIVLLRPVEERDLELIARWRNAPENWRYFFSPFFISISGQKKWYEKLLADRTRILFMIDTLEEGKTVGVVGLDNIDWHTQQCEGGQIVVDPAERQYGYAEEAAQLIIDYAFLELNMNRMYAICYPFNQVIDFVKLLGFQQEGVLRQAAFTNGKFYDKVVLGLLREEWFADMEEDYDG